MKYIINEKEFDSTNIESIIDEISLTESKNLSANRIQELIQVFDNTNNYKLLDTIALIFSEISRDVVLPSLVKKLNQLKESNHTSTLIYACSEYDCGEYIAFFADLLINYSYHMMIESYGILKSIKKPIQLSDKILVSKKLSDFLLTLKEQDDKYDYVVRAIDLIEDMETLRNDGI